MQWSAGPSLADGPFPNEDEGLPASGSPTPFGFILVLRVDLHGDA
jgi:hypothetical protein